MRPLRKWKYLRHGNVEVWYVSDPDDAELIIDWGRMKRPTREVTGVTRIYQATTAHYDRDRPDLGWKCRIIKRPEKTDG